MPDPTDDIATYLAPRPVRQQPEIAYDTTARLTTREIEVLSWIASGKSDWQVGRILGISAKTVNYHVENVKRKYAVATRIQAVVAAVRQGRITF
jgi:DNA-binding CsgD family transcriptional regulator